MAFDSIPQRAQMQAARRPGAPACFVKSRDTWTPTSWDGYAREIRQMGKGLIALGVEPGTTAGIIGFNRPEWTIFHLACMSIGAVPVGIYTTNSPQEIEYILGHAESTTVLVENAEQWSKIHQIRARLPKLQHILVMRCCEPIDSVAVTRWESVLTRGDTVADATFDQRLGDLKPEQLATLIYTSGTTGPPKGVMLSHENLAWTAMTTQRAANSGANDAILSYLPLSHIAEQMFTIHGSATAGYPVYFAQSIDELAQNLHEVQPRLFFGVPRVWEKFQSGVAAQLNQTAGFKRALLDWARRVGQQVSALHCRGDHPHGLLKWQYAVARQIVYRKVKTALGLGQARLCVSGAAPIAREVLDFFASLDIVICEVYGQSEDSGPTSSNLPGKTSFATVGMAIPGVEVRIADDGEILVRGPNVFSGYYKDPQATAETLVGGWLYSGDLGEIDSDGFLRITGRKKEIIITAGGENIAPKNIESALKQSPLVNEATVIGDRRKYLAALITLDPEASATFAEEHGVDVHNIFQHPTLISRIQQHVDAVNRHLARAETIKRFRILPRNFSIDDGELTPTLKVKRAAVYRNFADEIESMYAADAP